MGRRSFGQVYLRPDRGGWFAKYADPRGPKTGERGRYIVRRVKSEREGKAWLKAVRAALLAGTYQSPQPKEERRAPALTVDGALEAYIATKEAEGAAGRTVKVYRSARVRIAASGLGARDVETVTPKHVEEFLAWRRENSPASGTAGPSNATVALDLAVLAASFGRLVDLGTVTVNPCARVRRPKASQSRRPSLTDVEVRALLSACSSATRPLVVAALATGCRFSELAGLRWTDVDTTAGTLAIFRKKNRSADVLPLHPTLAAELRNLRETRTAAGRIPAAGDPVFATVAGEVRKSPGKGWRKALADSGLAARDGMDFHALRTTFATRFLAAGGSVADLRGILGHSSIAITNRYARSQDAGVRAGILRLDLPIDVSIPLRIRATMHTRCAPGAPEAPPERVPVPPLSDAQLKTGTYDASPT